MGLFNDQGSKQLEARLSALRDQLTEAEGTVKAAEEALEAALAAGAPSDKQLTALSIAKTKVTALESVISKAETALAEAQDREERAARLKEILAVEKQGRLKIETLARQHEKLLASARDLVALQAAFDDTVRELHSLGGGELQFNALPSANVMGILAAVTMRPPRNSFEDALRAAEAGLASELSELARRFESMIGSGKRECEEAGA